ncbi:TrmB family transcriptional regulator sugar-binding domain-containing protein [Candidatus Pyrohabitans sp.]
MKLLDIKEGKVLGVNFVDFIAIALVLFLAFSFARTVLAEELVFSGEEVYKAVKTYNKLESKGFLAEAEIRGTAIGDPTQRERNFSGVVVAARGGTLYIRNQHGDEFTVGGSMSYLEDVAAKEIRLMPLYSSSLSFYSKKERFGDFREFLDALKQLKQSTGASRLVLKGEISISQPGMRYLDVKNAIEGCFYCVGSRAYKTGEDLYVLSFRDIELGELEHLNLESGEVVTRKLRIYLGYEEELEKPKVEEAARAAVVQGFLREEGDATYVSVGELL